MLLWLQHCKLDDVASVMIGYDLNGADVQQWDHGTLGSSLYLRISLEICSGSNCQHQLTSLLILLEVLILLLRDC